MRPLLVLAIVSLFATPTEQQQGTAPPNKDVCKDICLEKEIADFTRVIYADSDKPKIGFLVENIAWSDDYRRVAEDVLQKDFSDRFVSAGNQSIGVPVLYIAGTSAVANGAQFVNVRIQLNSDMMLLPENAKTLFDIHPAKLGDPTRVLRGELVLVDDGTLLAPMSQGVPYELWHQLNLQEIRKSMKKELSEIVADWDKAGRK